MSNTLDAARERILVALDFDSVEPAAELARKLTGKVGAFKVGLELVNAVGFDIFDRLRDAGVDRIFYDAKFHDIPNTVAGAIRAAAKRGVWMVNVHASGGSAMLRAAREAANTVAQPPLLIGVTLLTSIGEAELRSDLRVEEPVQSYVTHLCEQCRQAGLEGVVASPLEVDTIRRQFGPDFVTVIPGVRPAGTATNDQARIATPGDTIRSGARYLVLGRAITRAADPVQAAESIANEIEAALAQNAGAGEEKP